LTSTAGPGLGAEPALGPPYAGEDGRSESFGRHCGGGGSIGADAVADLVMTTTFRPGSGGGGGSGTWNSFIDGAGCGGGGGGGAVRVASITQISIGPSAAIRAVGGPGGSFTGGNGGGGGSGGAIYLSAPALNVMGTLDASGATRPAGGNGGGSGGMGRIRISTLPDRCAIAATTVPPMLDGCNPADMPGYAYVASYPF
jgi:hypothetical protein